MTDVLRGKNRGIQRFKSASWALRFTLLILIITIAGTVARAQSVPPNREPAPSPTSPSGEPDGADGNNPPSLVTPLEPQDQGAIYHPITPRQRLRWFITNTIGPPHLVGGIFVAGFGTALNRPQEYGTHWGGFGDRYGMRLTGIVTGNAMEASIGYTLREDPRYFRVQDRPFKDRIRNVVRLTYMARQSDGSYGPAYARYAAIAGNNFLSNSWRVQSESNVHDALIRTAEGFAGRMAVNAFEEFWPSVKELIFKKHD